MICIHINLIINGCGGDPHNRRSKDFKWKVIFNKYNMARYKELVNLRIKISKNIMFKGELDKDII